MRYSHHHLLKTIVDAYKKAGRPRAWAWEPDTPEERQLAEELLEQGWLEAFTGASYRPSYQALA